MAAQLKAQISAMQRKLAKMEVGTTTKPPKRKTPQVIAPPVQRAPRKRRARRAGGVNADGGVFKISRNELLGEVKGGQIFSVSLAPMSWTWISTISKSFERFTIHSATLEWKPAVGTTEAGLCCYGVDWNANSTPTTRAQILAYTPVQDNPVWQPSTLVLPSSKLMTRKEYSTADTKDIPGIIVASCTSDPAKVAGELWIRYDISMYGTRR